MSVHLVKFLEDIHQCVYYTCVQMAKDPGQTARVCLLLSFFFQSLFRNS